MIPIRDENPSETIPYVTYLFIMVNVMVFALQTLVLVTYGSNAAEALVYAAGAVPVEITRLRDLDPVRDLVPPPFTILTSMFMHGSLLHLLGNMWFLWIFGDNVEDFMGHGRYFLFYIGTGIAAAAAHVASAPGSGVPVVGASGAISGVLGAYVLLYPRARVLTVIPIFIFLEFVHLPAFLFLGVWFVMQVLSAGARHAGSGGVAFIAHVGGFIAGLLAVPFFERKRRRRRIDTYWE